jgi:hypothetical protein
MFERLTHRDSKGDVWIKDAAHVDEQGQICMLSDRLAAYEDSGLSPEEVVEIKKYLNMWIEICKENNVSIVQFKKWAEAEQDGRLVVLPCKVGDVVYEPRKDRGIISEYEITEIIINKYGVSFFRWNLKEGIYSHLGGFPVECLGKTVFLTREAAEKAIAEGLK